jgi:hypothetical protein
MNIRLRFSAAHQSGAARIESRRNNNVDELAEEQKKTPPIHRAARYCFEP